MLAAPERHPPTLFLCDDPTEKLPASQGGRARRGPSGELGRPRAYPRAEERSDSGAPAARRRCPSICRWGGAMHLSTRPRSSSLRRGRPRRRIRREKFIEYVAPTANGGRAAISCSRRCTASYAIDFRLQHFRARGKGGAGSNMTGAGGNDLVVKVPVGRSWPMTRSGPCWPTSPRKGSASIS